MRQRVPWTQSYDLDVTDELASDGLLQLTEQENKMTLTKNGDDYARRLIRAHRLAERLLYDVLGGDYESGACEFEYTVSRISRNL
jgi:DtxR family Mn-dependent transcriptional regulator